MIENALSTDKQTNPLTTVDSSLQNLIDSTDDSKLDIQMKRLLRKYKERKTDECERNKKWMHLHSIAPDPNILDPEDEKSLAAARTAIGSYKLTQSVEQCSTVKKLSELLNLKDQIYNIKDAYNQKVFATREKKRLLCEYVEGRLEALKKIHSELPEDQRKMIENIPKIDEDVEYAEIKFMVIHGHWALLFVFSPFKTTPQTMRQQRPQAGFKVNQKDTKKNEFSDLIGKVLELSVHQTDPSHHDSSIGETRNTVAEDLLHLRLKTKLFEQDQIIRDIEQRITDFDNEISDLKHSKLAAEIEAKFLECFYLTVYQELLIIKDSEKIETDLNDEKLLIKNEKTNYELELCSHKSNLETHKRNLQRLFDARADLEMQIALELKNDEAENQLIEVCRVKQETRSRSISRVAAVIPESNTPDGCDARQITALRDEKGLIEKQIEDSQNGITLLECNIKETMNKMCLVDSKLSEKQAKINEITVNF